MNFCIYHKFIQVFILYFFLQLAKVDGAVKDLLASAGVTEKQMQDPSTKDFVYDFIQKQGGLDAVKKFDLF